MGFREMRRKNQALSPEECAAVLARGTSWVLALAGDDGYPYAVPMSYIADGGKIYFHCAVTGHKLDAIRSSDKASFCVIDQDQVIPERFTTGFRSVIAFGRIRIMEEDGERRMALEKLAEKYSPHILPAKTQEEIRDGWGRVCLLEFSVEHLSGKEGRELAENRQ